MIKSSDYKIVYFKVFAIFLFVYSGLMKWISFPIDPTLVFGSLCFLFLLWDIMFTNNVLKYARIGLPVYLFIFFCTWYIFTAIYTVSDSFWIEKVRSILLLVITFLFPIYSLRNVDFEKIARAYLVLTSVAVILLLYLQLNDMLGLITTLSDEIRAEFKIPDYIAISELLIIGFLVSLLFKNKFLVILRLLIVFIVIQLGARAPVLFMGFSYILFLVVTVKLKLFQFKYIVKIAIAIVALIFIFRFWQGAELLKDRLFSLQNITSDQSAAERIVWMKESLNQISEHPFLGVGIGGAGIKLIGYDENAYPHNHFIETYLEAGLPGFIIICFFWITIFSQFKFLTADKRYLVLNLVILFLFLNYMKSGSFSDIRKMFVWVSFFLVYINQQILTRQLFLRTPKLINTDS